MEIKKDELAITTRDSGEIMASEHTASAEMEIQATIILAKKFPRNEVAADQKLKKACLRLTFAEEAVYSFPRGGQTIQGPSVSLAREAARLWGNIRYGLKVIQNLEDEITIEGWAWDIETNVKVACQDAFQKLIFRKQGGWIKPDERDLRELINRRGAITIRNSILQLLPRDLIEDAQTVCMKTRKENNKNMDPEKVMKEWIKAFASLKPFGVSVEQLEKYLSHPITECSMDEWDGLKSIYKSIADGNSSWKEYVGENGDKPSEKIEGKLNPEDLKSKKSTKNKDVVISVEDAIAEVGKQTTVAGLEKVRNKYSSLTTDKNFTEAVEQIRANIESAEEEKSPEDGRENGMFDQQAK